MWIVRRVGLALVLATASAPALAHFVENPSSHPVQWSFDWWVVLSLAVAAFLYVLGVWRLYAEVGGERVLDRWRIAAFTAGMTTLFIALCSPVDTIGGELFSMHMVQHLMLMLVAPPLLVWSRPNIAFIWAFSPAWRKRIGRLWTGAGLGRAMEALMHPVMVFVLFSGTFAFWHLPGPYRAALYNDFIHALEHLSFFLPSLAFWTMVIEPSERRRLSYGASLAFVGLTAVLCALPGALIVLAPMPLYPDHAAGAAAWGLTLMEDQQLAGLLMWIPGGIVYLLACVWLFLRLMDDAEGKAVAWHRSVVSMSLLVVALPLMLGGCDAAESTPKDSPIGDTARGMALIKQHGCGGCHVIPGIRRADGLVGPPLNHMGKRVYIAGVLRNTPGNMITWLRNPQAVVPGNAMPDMGLSEDEARDIAAYLSTLD